MTELEQGVWCAAFALAFRDGEVLIIPGDIDIAEALGKTRMNIVDASDDHFMTADEVSALCSAAADRAVEALRRLDK